MGILSKLFLGKTIRESAEIHRSDDTKYRISSGLYTNFVSDVVWLKFWRKAPIMGSSSMGFGIAVRSFSDFRSFLESACAAERNNSTAGARASWMVRMVVRMHGGMPDIRCLGEYRCAGEPSSSFHLFSYPDRKGGRHVLFRYDNHFVSADFKALETLRDSLEDPSGSGPKTDAPPPD